MFISSTADIVTVAALFNMVLISFGLSLVFLIYSMHLTEKKALEICAFRGLCFQLMSASS